MAQLKNTVVNGSLKVNGRAETNSLITDDIKKTDGTSYVGNGTLTIKQGSQSWTFYANQNDNKEITLESFNTDTHDTSHGTDIENNFHSQLYLGSFNSAIKKVTKTGVVNYGLNPQFFSSMLVRLNASSYDALSNLRDCISSLYSYLNNSQDNTYLTSHIGLLSIPSRTLEDSSEGLISPSKIENNSRPWIYSVIRNGDTNKPAPFILFTDFIKTYIMNISDSTISRIAVDADTLNGKTSTDFASSIHTHDYLPLTGGTLSGNLELSVNKKIATLSHVNLLSYTSDSVNIGYTAFNLKLQSNYKPVWYKPDETTESILTASDWVPNSKDYAGYVLAGNGYRNSAWMTDNDGNPGWRAIRTFLCGTSTIATPTTPVIFNADYFAVNNQSRGFTLSVKKADTATTANSATNATNAEHANSADMATTANSATNAINADTLDGWHIDAVSEGVDAQWIAAFVPEVEGNWSKGTVRAMNSQLFARKTDLDNVTLTATGDAMNPVYIDTNGKPAKAHSFKGLVEASVANNVLTLTIL